MQEKESVMLVRFELKILSVGITVTLVTEFSIHTAQPLKVLIVLNADGTSCPELSLSFIENI